MATPARILVIVNNLQQAAYRVRIAALIQPLRRRGVELVVKVRPRRWLALRRFFDEARDFDAVIVQRKLLEPWEARRLRRAAGRILYDIDDALMFHPRPVSFLSRWRTRRRFHATAAVVDHVVAGNEYLADQFRARGVAASVIPTCVNPADYQPRQHDPTDRPRLVWIGSRSTLPYLAAIAPQIAEAAGRVPGLGLVTIADATLENAPFPVEHIPWSADSEAQALLRGDIGIAPTPCDPWTLGKCGFKLIQYMAAGLPAIASAVGANAQIVQDGQTGFLAQQDREWPRLIQQLAGEAFLRASLGTAGRRRVEEHFSTERAADAWARLLLGTASAPSARAPEAIHPHEPA